jgi:large-conductance mechanosensitive channel
MKEIIKQIDIDGSILVAWMFFGGPLVSSFSIMLLEPNAVDIGVFVFFLIIFLIASPILFYPVIQAYNKVIDDAKKEKK